MLSLSENVKKDITNASADVFPLIGLIVSSLLPLSSPPPLSLFFFFFLFFLGGGGRAPGAPPPESAPDYFTYR